MLKENNELRAAAQRGGRTGGGRSGGGEGAEGGGRGGRSGGAGGSKRRSRSLTAGEGGKGGKSAKSRSPRRERERERGRGGQGHSHGGKRRSRSGAPLSREERRIEEARAREARVVARSPSIDLADTRRMGQGSGGEVASGSALRSWGSAVISAEPVIRITFPDGVEGETPNFHPDASFSLSDNADNDAAGGREGAPDVVQEGFIQAGFTVSFSLRSAMDPQEGRVVNFDLGDYERHGIKFTPSWGSIQPGQSVQVFGVKMVDGEEDEEVSG